MPAALLTPNEVAELSGAAKTVIEKAVEHRVLQAALDPARGRGSRRQTLLPSSAVAYASAVKALGRRLTIADRKRVADAFVNITSDRVSRVRVELAPGLMFEAGQDVEDSVMRAERYASERDRCIEINEDVMGGTPVIKGTRLTVYAIAARMAGGDPVSDLMDDYPDITANMFDAACIYARTHPLVGRPGGRPWQNSQAA